jgi:hypothetical protein
LDDKFEEFLKMKAFYEVAMNEKCDYSTSRIEMSSKKKKIKRKDYFLIS